MTKDVWIGSALVLFGGVLLVSATGIRRVVPIGISPAFYPMLLSGLLMICGLITIIQGFRYTEAARPGVKASNNLRSIIWGLAVFLTLSAIIVVGWQRIGFIPVAIIVVAFVGQWMGARPLQLAATAIIAPGLFYYAFTGLLGVPLPRGVLGVVLPL